MPKPRLSRETLLPLLAAHIIANGLTGASLRPLARAARTSDRMLLYHFGTKQALMAALLDHISAQFAVALDAVLPPGRAASRAACLDAVAKATRGAAFAPYLALWWQIVAGAAQGDAGFRAAAGAVMDRLAAWLEDHLPADDSAPQAAARHLLTLLEGAQMFDAVGRADIADTALATAGEMLAGWRPAS